MIQGFTVSLMFMCMLMGVPADAKSLSDEEKKEGYELLFNGKDLSGWVIMETPSWQVKDGLIICTGQGHGWLRSTKEYQDFVLRLEYNVSQGGNSGVFIRSTEEGIPAYSGMEIQILDDHGKPPTTTSTGSVYAAVAPKVNAARPSGEWNQVEIACLGRTLRVRLNGELLYVVNLDDPELNESLPQGRKLTDRVPKGYIGLQNHSSYIEFRNIRIKTFLPEASDQPK